MKLFLDVRGLAPDQSHRLRDSVSRRLGRFCRKGALEGRGSLSVLVQPVAGQADHWEARALARWAGERLSAHSDPMADPMAAVASAFDRLDMAARGRLLERLKQRRGRRSDDRAGASANEAAAEDIRQALVDTESHRVGRQLLGLRPDLIAHAAGLLEAANRGSSQRWFWVSVDDLVDEALLRVWPEVEAGLSGGGLADRLRRLVARQLQCVLDDEQQTLLLGGVEPAEPLDPDPAVAQLLPDTPVLIGRRQGS